ncbi:MAG: DUF6390 family protein [Dehalococcoidia bacterium]
MPLDGTLLFARYAFMPNRLAYCGGDDNHALFDYCKENHTDPGLVMLLEKFQAALPYLKLIARSNGICDPFDWRVVEAYWLGNELLDRVNMSRFYDSLTERFSAQINSKALGYLLSKPPMGARPHHSFHVFDVHSRAGTLTHNLDTMENCRIGWGRISEINGANFIVSYQPLEMEAGKLKLGNEERKSVLRQIDGKGFVTQYEMGDWISFHWDWACDVLTERQVRNLHRYTCYHLELANQTL